MFQEFKQERLIKELEQLDPGRRSSVDTEQIRQEIKKKNFGANLLKFNEQEFDMDLVNFYLGDPEIARKNSPGYTEPIVSSMKTNGRFGERGLIGSRDRDEENQHF